MAGIDIDPFGEHESRPDDNTETIKYSLHPSRRKINLGTRKR